MWCMFDLTNKRPKYEFVTKYFPAQSRTWVLTKTEIAKDKGWLFFICICQNTFSYLDRIQTMNRKTDASSLLHGRNIAQDALDFFSFFALSRTHMWVVNKSKSQSKWEHLPRGSTNLHRMLSTFLFFCHYKLICWVVSPKQKNPQYLLSSCFLSVAFFSLFVIANSCCES